jgi:dTDP-4-dehydrorhamnose 3,5-epimerase
LEFDIGHLTFEADARINLAQADLRLTTILDFLKQHISGLYLIKPFHSEDDRGSFVKTFHAGEFAKHHLEHDFKESYFSESVKGAIRGMHFQVPPHDHAKLVFAIQGSVLDVVIDLRKKSATYKQFRTFQLDDVQKAMLYLPSGMAHGFCALSEKATLYYLTTSVYSQKHDTGIRYDSFGFEWPVANPILSERDLGFEKFEDFDSPF